MTPAQIRKAVKGLMQSSTLTTTLNSSSVYSFNQVDIFPAFQHLFNQDALDVLKIKTNGMIHQYNRVTDERHALFNTFELLSLLGLKSAINNPCEGMYVREVARVFSFGFTCEANETVQATHKLIEAINDMSSSKWLCASLYNLGMLELNDADPNVKTKRYAIFAHLGVFMKHEADVEATYGWLKFPEGGIPPRFK